jgi:DNA end-binding protein Ku
LLDGEEIPYEHVVRGYEYEKDRFVALTEDDLRAVPTRSARNIDIFEFVNAADIDPFFFQRPYYLEPDELGLKPYHLLRRAMQQQEKIAIGKLVLRAKEHLIALRPLGRLIVLETMNWPDEIRDPSFPILEEEPSARGQELEMAGRLVETLSADWHPEEFKDDYREALLLLIRDKVAGKKLEVPAEPEPGELVDFVAALKASVEAAEVRIKRERRLAQST